jgi:hypothetical protein
MASIPTISGTLRQLASPTAAGFTRKWTRLQDYSDEVSNACIYAGFHYRFSTEVGKDMGRKIGELTVGTQLLGAVAAAQPNPDLPWKGATWTAMFALSGRLPSVALHRP